MLINLTWFDIITVGCTLVSIILVQILNAVWSTVDVKKSASALACDKNAVIKSLKINELKSLVPKEFVPSDATSTNFKLQKLQTEQNENGPLSANSSILSRPLTAPPTPPTPPPPPPPPPRLLSSSSPSPTVKCNQWNDNGVHMSNLPDHFSDEYYEDEDTLSLENLFPCDQTEIYKSKKISYIIDEFIQTEASYVRSLKNGLKNYGDLQKCDSLPESLKGEDKQNMLLGNIAEILKLHEREMLPMMLGHQRDLKSMFDKMAELIDKNQFYCYVTFTMHKKTSLELRKRYREFFQSYQNTINDRLGIDSFLVQPIQRLTRYPLLLQQLIAEFYKSGINCKPVLSSLCKLDTRMRRLLKVVNQSEEILSIEEVVHGIDFEHLGCFRQSTEFDAYNHRSRKKFRCKVFLFEQCLLCTEVRKRRLVYRNHYTWSTIILKVNSSKSISILMKPESNSNAASGLLSESGVKPEYAFSSPEAISINQWLRCARRIIEHSRIEDSQRGKLVLPMDLVLGVLFGIWFTWHCLRERERDIKYSFF